jgi:hypothetical protein
VRTMCDDFLSPTVFICYKVRKGFRLGRQVPPAIYYETLILTAIDLGYSLSGMSVDRRP